jgi:hypothetical protein
MAELLEERLTTKRDWHEMEERLSTQLRELEERLRIKN